MQACVGGQDVEHGLITSSYVHCRMHSKYGEAVINLFNGELVESEEFSKNVSPLVAVSAGKQWR